MGEPSKKHPCRLFPEFSNDYEEEQDDPSTVAKTLGTFDIPKARTSSSAEMAKLVTDVISDTPGPSSGPTLKSEPTCYPSEHLKRRRPLGEWTAEEIGTVLLGDVSEQEEEESDGENEEDQDSEEDDPESDEGEPRIFQMETTSIQPAGMADQGSWHTVRTPVRQIPFQQHAGLKIFPDGNNPIDFFSHIFDSDWLQHILHETNRYGAALKIKEVKENQEKGKKRKTADWKVISVEEFRIFLGLTLLMGITRNPSIQSYWTKDEIFDTPNFRKHMSRDRYEQILKALHFAENPESGETLEDALYKIRPMIDRFCEKMRSIYVAEKDLSIYESLVLWRGRLRFRRYIKGKRHKYGFKLYMLTESKGLLLRLLMYQGATDAKVDGKGHAAKVVHKLLEDFKNKGHSVYMDNFYNSVALTEELLTQDTYVTGTLRADRRDDPPILHAKIGKGKVVAAHTTSGITVLKWKDERDVRVISSEFGPQMIEVSSRTRIMSKPEAVHMYNNNMSGIDFLDQLLSYYPMERKTLKWYRKIGFHIIDLAMHNAFILYRRNSQDTKKVSSILKFRCEVIKSLLANNPRVVEAINPKRSTLSKKVHVAGITDSTEIRKKSERRKRCLVCYEKYKHYKDEENKKKKDKFVHTFCPDCPNKPFMCIPHCFKEHHKY